MAVSGKTAAPYEIPYFESGDHPPDMAAVTKAMAEKLAGEKWLSQSLKPTTGVKQASSSPEVTGGFILIPGCKLEITPAVASKLLVWSYLGLAELQANKVVEAGLSVDGGAVLANRIAVQNGAAIMGANSFSTFNELALTAAAHTVELKALFSGSPGGITAARTSFFYQLVAS